MCTGLPRARTGFLTAPPPGFPPGAALQSDIRRYLALRYDLCEVPVEAAGRQFRILGVRDTNVLVDAVTPREFAVDERLPYWSQVWSAARSLASAAALLPDLPGMRVLELGCGLGLVGIAVADAGAHVTMTDYDEDALLFARCTALSTLPPEAAARVHVCILDWRHPPPLAPFPLILGADVLYERSMFRPLLGCIRTLLAPGGAAILADPGRSTAEEFLAAAADWGFIVSSSACGIPDGGRIVGIHHHRLERG